MVTPLRLHFTGRDSGRQCTRLTYEQRIQSCACVYTKMTKRRRRRKRRRRKRRRERGFEWNAFRIMRHVRIPRVRLRGNEGNGEQVGSRVSPSERFAVREMRRRLFRKVPRCCLSPSSSPLSPSPYQDKLILMPDTVVDVRAHSA